MMPLVSGGKMADTRQRLKQKDLVAALFVLFSEEYDNRGVDSIFDLELPLSDIREYLHGRFGIDYTSDAWILTQIRKYEEEIGVELFRRHDTEGGPRLIGIAYDMRSYFQKRHLYVTQKIRVANGVLDLIMNEGPRAAGALASAYPGSRVGILLGAGSTITRIAEALAESIRAKSSRSTETERPWLVATHNLGVIQVLGSSSPAALGATEGAVELLVPEGRIDPATYAILGKNEELYRRLELDWSVEGTSFLAGGELFVESEEETAIKSAILRRCSGRKVLVLTGHEAVDERPACPGPYGRVDEYDFVVLPRVSREVEAQSRFDLAMRELRTFLDPWVLNWNYEVLRVRHTRP